jgi:hypothetical protein
LFKFFQVNPMIGREHRHQVLGAGFDHNNLSVVPSLNVLCLRNGLRGERFGMVENLVADFNLPLVWEATSRDLCVKKFSVSLEFGSKLRDSPP